jgi:hypothetical protein
MIEYVIDEDSPEMKLRTNAAPVSRKPLDAVWVAWGETHIREAIGAARLCMAYNRRPNPGMEYYVYVLDDWHGVPESLLSAQESRGIHIVKMPEAEPTNPAMYDIDRLRMLARHDRPAMYFDTDCYVATSIPLDLIPPGISTFGIGLGRFGFGCMPTHGIIEDWLDASTVVYWRDFGLTIDDYEDRSGMWPFVRINLGLVHSSSPPAMREFVDMFAAMHLPFAHTRYFGVGEMLFTALFNKGMIPDYNPLFGGPFAGWNKIWPFRGVNIEFGLEMDTKRPGVVSVFHPCSRHQIMHVGHFGFQVHEGSWETDRAIALSVNDDDHLVLRLAHHPKRTGVSSAVFSPLWD